MTETPRNIDDVVATMTAVKAGIESVIEGKQAQVETALVVLLAGGHLLIEDVPGVGKTMLAKALARSIKGSVRRIQFTPDLLPSDVTGVSVFNQETRSFEFKPGGIFANIVVGDEINRASPKTQSALLEAMAEQQVSVDGVTYGLSSPFMVIATQNPIEMEGTYPLPEAQLDRFMARIEMGYPARRSEVAMLGSRGQSDPLAALQPVTDVATVAKLVHAVRGVYVATVIREYIVSIVAATRTSSSLKLGASPRSSLQLMASARALAALSGRDYVIPEDVVSLAPTVLAHRVLPSVDAQVARRTTRDIISELAARVPTPERR